MEITKNIFNSTFFDNKNILITGGTGTLGNVLTTFFLTKTNCKKICIFSRDEFKQFNMKKKFKDLDFNNFENISNAFPLCFYSIRWLTRW